MNIVDYTGKLNSHEEYILMLKKIQEKCDYIEIVIIDEKEIDDKYFMEIEGECRGNVTKSMIRELENGPTLQELSSLLKLEIEVFGYDKSEPEWIEHYHYNNGEVVTEYALPPYVHKDMVDEYEVG